MTKTKELLISKDILTSLKLEVNSKNIDKIMKILEQNKIILTKSKNKLDNYECEGQLDIYNYPEYLPNNYDDIEL